jgi:hypothetical protein
MRPRLSEKRSLQVASILVGDDKSMGGDVVGFFDRFRKTHHVTVNLADPPEKDHEPYYVAICECGWLGDIHDHAGPAFSDATSHHENVDLEVKRPLDPDYVVPEATRQYPPR